MNKEQEDYIKLEEAAKKWIDGTDQAQYEPYELLAMFASKEIEKLFSLASINKRSELFICSFCKSDQTYLSEGGYVRTCLKCDKTGIVSE